MKSGEKRFRAVWGVLVAALIAALPAVCDAAEASTFTPSYAYQNEETSILIFGSGFPNPHVAATLDGGAVTQLTRVSDSMLVAKIVSAETGFHTLAVCANGLPVEGPGQIEIRPKPPLPEDILREAEERIYAITREFFCFLMEEARRTTMAMNTAQNKQGARAAHDGYIAEHLTYVIEHARVMDTIVGRAETDIVLAGGGQDLIADLHAFTQAESAFAGSAISRLMGYVATAAGEFQGAPPPQLVQQKFPYELRLRFGGVAGSPLSATYVDLPPALEVGSASTTLAGQMRLRLDSSPNPNIALVTVIESNLAGTPLSAGGINFGQLAFAQDPASPSTGTLNLRTGEIVLNQRHLVTSPLLQALGLAPVELTFATVGVIHPISHILLEIVTKGRSNPNSRFRDITGFLAYGKGSIPAEVPVLGGQSFLAVGEGCNNPKPYAPRPSMVWNVPEGTEKPTSVWSVSGACEINPALTVTPANGTTAVILDVRWNFNPPATTASGSWGGTRFPHHGTANWRFFFGNIAPPSCTYGTMTVYLAVNKPGYKELLCATKVVFHW